MPSNRINPTLHSSAAPKSLHSCVSAAVSVLKEVQADLNDFADGTFARTFPVVIHKRRTLLRLSEIGCSFPVFLEILPTERPPLSPSLQQSRHETTAVDPTEPTQEDFKALEHALYGRQAHDVLSSHETFNRWSNIEYGVWSYVAYLDSILFEIHRNANLEHLRDTPTASTGSSPASSGGSEPEEVGIATFLSSNCERPARKKHRSAEAVNIVALGKRLRREREKCQSNILLRDIARSASLDVSHRLHTTTAELEQIRNQRAKTDAYRNGIVDWFGRLAKDVPTLGKGSYGVVLDLESECAKLCTQFQKCKDVRSKNVVTKRVTIPEAVCLEGVAVQEACHEGMVSEILRDKFGDGTLRSNIIPSSPLTLPIGLLMPKATCDAQFLASFLRRGRGATAVVVEILVHVLSYHKDFEEDDVFDGRLSLCEELFGGNGAGFAYQDLKWPDIRLGSSGADDLTSPFLGACHSLSCVWDFTSLSSTLCALGYWLRRAASAEKDGNTLTCVDVEKERMNTFLQFCSQSVKGMISLLEAGLVQCDCSLSNFVVFDRNSPELSPAKDDPWLLVAVCDYGAIRQVGVEQFKRGRIPKRKERGGGDCTPNQLISELTREMRRSNPVAISPELIQCWVNNKPFIATEKLAVNSLGALAEDMLRYSYGSLTKSKIRATLPSRKLDRSAFLSGMRKFIRGSATWLPSIDLPVLRLVNWGKAVAKYGGNESRASFLLTQQAASYFDTVQSLFLEAGTVQGKFDNIGSVLRFMEEEYGNKAEGLSEESKLSSFHQLLMRMRGVSGNHRILRDLGAFFQSRAMQGSSFVTGEKGHLEMKMEARQRVPASASASSWDTFQLISLLELSYGHKIGFDECAILGRQMIELAGVMEVHSKCIMRMMEFISRCGLSDPGQRPGLEECECLISELLAEAGRVSST